MRLESHSKKKKKKRNPAQPLATGGFVGIVGINFGGVARRIASGTEFLLKTASGEVRKAAFGEKEGGSTIKVAVWREQVGDWEE